MHPDMSQGAGPGEQARHGASAPADDIARALADAEDQAVAALDRAMTGGRPAGGEPPPSPADSKRAPIRGPRVVQAGREHRKGLVVSVGPDDIFVEFGPKELGVTARAQWTDEDVPKVGDELELVVDRYSQEESLFLCSRPGAVQKAAWELLEIGQVVEARVTGVNKGGLDLEVAGHRAFMPAGQISFDRINDLTTLVGEKFACVVTQVDRRGRGNIVLSRREVLRQEREEQAKKLRDSLQEGATVEGTVRKIMPFGAFVDLGGVDGLIHISDLTHDRIGHGENAIARIIKEGQRVTVKVLKLDWENDRLSLGLKQLQADPFAQAAGDIKEGAEVTGRVTRLAEFGAFIEIAPGVEGLAHVSELAWRRVAHPGDVLQENQVIPVKVLKIDPESRRISLSVKATQPAPEQPARSGPGGRGGDRRAPAEPRPESPELRRLREKFGKQGLKGGLS